MKAKKLAFKFLTVMSFAFLWTQIVRIVLKYCSGGEQPWMAISVSLAAAIIPLVQGIFHYYEPIGKELNKPKMLFGKVKISTRLCLMSQAMTLLLVCCAIGLIGATNVDWRTMAMMFVIVGLCFAGEALGYYAAKLIELASSTL